MRGHSFEHIAIGVALSFMLAAAQSAGAGSASSSTTDTTQIADFRAIETAIPLPDAADVGPLTAADVLPSAAEIEARIPVPAAADLPLLTQADIGGIATASVGTTTPAGYDILDRIPMPDAAELPPPGLKDVVDMPFAALPAADIPVAMKLSEILAARPDRGADRRMRAALANFYKERGFRPLWIADSRPSARAQAAIARLKAAEGDGLDANDYATPDLGTVGTSPQALAEAELKLSHAVLTYGRDAQIGRVAPGRISSNIEYNRPAPEPADILNQVADASDVAAALDGFNPPHKGFQALRAKLAAARRLSAEQREVVQIPDGPIVRPGMEDPRVPLVRERLAIGGDRAGMIYDNDVFEAVKAFQQSAGLSADGMLGPSTLRALNTPRRVNQIDTIIANMERWRWLPRDLGRVHVVVNIPDFTLEVVRNRAVVWRTKIVVGKPATPTPLISAAMTHITVNPTWNVPPSIVYNEYLPALQQDPGSLARMGLKVSRNPDGSIHIWQPPGDRNALGRIRFNFPNRFLVYQHDTPDKHLFGHERRAYSHGCMRVQDPLRYGEVLLSIALPNQGYTQDRLRSMFGNSERDIRLPAPIPVYLTYQTAFVDDAGAIVIRDDLYGYDSRLQAALKGDYRVADAAVAEERSREASAAQRIQTSRRAARYEVRNEGFNLFQFLFQ